MDAPDESMLLAGDTERKTRISEANPCSVNIRTNEELVEYLEVCSGQTPIMEGHLCKDISKPKIFDKFRRRYFILFRGVLLYYNYKSQYEVDKSRGLVSCLYNVCSRSIYLWWF